ncbi:MAG: hypothetical protein QXR79_02515 [Candidatus Bathyarchaeia archaeon]
MKKKTIIITLIALLTLTIFPQIISPRVNAVDVKITSITPTTHRGKVGETIRITGTINTTDGWYQILFNNTLVVNGTASGNNVNASFTVPALPSGNYTLTLLDKTANITDTSWFVIETAYILKVSKPEYPRQLQQNATVNISISITGGRANTVYYANITVKTPANETYSKSIQLSNTTDTGIGNATITYPFGNAHTNYTGTYTVSFNGTLASDTFFIGLTDLAEYHRNDIMKIWAVGYFLYPNVTVTIKPEGGGKIYKLYPKVTDGIVNETWTLPVDINIGNYSIAITPPNVKTVNDAQTFAVPGFRTEIVPRNLAGEPVPDVLVRIHDKWANETYNVTSNRSGVATKQLERGEYNATAYFKKVKVGQALTFSIENESLAVNFTCQLTSLNITVVSALDPTIKIPFVSIRLFYNFTTDLDGRKAVNETVSFQTDITGTAKQHSFLLNASYKLNASRYEQIFNQTTFANLERCAWNNITIDCSERVLHVNVTDWEGKPIENALVELQELMGGLYDTKSTGNQGNVTFNCIFGKYHLKVYSDKILLNETTVELFNNRTVTIRCALYNLPICIKVVDYFGQPIANANVILERGGVKINSSISKADGIASFREIGGNLTIKVYLANKDLPDATLTTNISEKREYSNPILVKLEKYVVLSGLLIDTAQFALSLLIVATIVLVAIIEIVRRKRLKSGKVSS